MELRLGEGDVVTVDRADYAVRCRRALAVIVIGYLPMVDGYGVQIWWGLCPGLVREGDLLYLHSRSWWVGYQALVDWPWTWWSPIHAIWCMHPAPGRQWTGRAREIHGWRIGWGYRARILWLKTPI
ncbi:MAG TPA: hypothetical protein VIJ94_09315 [Caulobacteraceae bacterium]